MPHRPNRWYETFFLRYRLTKYDNNSKPPRKPPGLVEMGDGTVLTAKQAGEYIQQLFGKLKRYRKRLHKLQNQLDRGELQKARACPSCATGSQASRRRLPAETVQCKVCDYIWLYDGSKRG